MDVIAPKSIGKLDMVIAFDTTGSMASYIGAVCREVAELIPRLFKNNDDLRLGIVAFGDYCDMESALNFGNAYLCMPECSPHTNLNETILIQTNKKFRHQQSYWLSSVLSIVQELVISDLQEIELLKLKWRKCLCLCSDGSR